MSQNFFVVDEYMSKSLAKINNNNKKSNLVLPVAVYQPRLQKVDRKNTLFYMIRPAITIAQCWGLFPVSGVRAKTPDALQFKWLSLRTLYTLFCLSGNIVMAFFFFWWIAHRGLKLENMGSICFYSTSLFCTILFFRLAYVWPKLSRDWQEIENQFANYPPATNVRMKYSIILTVVLILALIEHILAIAISFGWLSNCPNENLAILHIRADFPQWFCYIEYSHFKAFLSEAFNWASTFNWNFNDIFIVLIAEAMTEKFRQLNAKMKNIDYRSISNDFFKVVREDYNKLSQLCNSLNSATCHLVSLSFLSNILQICIQLYNILRDRDTLVEYFYYYFSLGFLIGRAIGVSVYASAIYDESRVPMKILNSVPSVWYNDEVGRFIQQIHTTVVAMTGSNFFPVTRNLLISVSGTIIAYELVLIQLPRPVTKIELFFSNATDAQKLAYLCNVTRLCER